MSSEGEKQEKILSKLQWLNERCKLDFKGNPPPFETKKTLTSVQRERRAKARALVGDSDFLPFWHGSTPLALDATRSSYIDIHSSTKAFPDSRRKNVYGAQAVDPATGLTEIQLALSWNVPHVEVSSQRQVSAARSATWQAPAKADSDFLHLESLTPQERAAAYRVHLIQHPKCTVEGMRLHQGRWKSGTQLSEPIVKPPMRPRNTALDQRNAVRAVHLLHPS